MARSLKFALAAVVAVSAAPATAGVTFFSSKAALDLAATTTLVETFEAASLPGVTRNASLAGFSAHGITYTPNGPNVYVADAGYNNFGAAVGTTTSSVLTSNGDEDFTLTFAALRTAVGFDTYSNGLGPGTVRVFGTGNTLLGTFNLSPSFSGIGYLGITSTDAIQAVRWTTTLGGQLNTGIDNVSLGEAITGTTVVPLPPALALMLGGLGLLGTMGRRRAG